MLTGWSLYLPSLQSSQGGGHRTLLYGHAILLRHYHSCMVRLHPKKIIEQRQLWFQFPCCSIQPYFYMRFWQSGVHVLNENFLPSTWAVWLHLGHSQTSWPLTWAYRKIPLVKTTLGNPFSRCNTMLFFLSLHLTDYWNSLSSSGIVKLLFMSLIWF